MDGETNGKPTPPELPAVPFAVACPECGPVEVLGDVYDDASLPPVSGICPGCGERLYWGE